MAKIIDFATRTSRRRSDEPDEEIIGILEHFLESAREGSLRSLVIIGVDGAGNPEGAFSVDPTHADLLCDRLAGAAERIATIDKAPLV